MMHDGGTVPTSSFYGADQAAIHDARFGDLAVEAAATVVEHLRAAGRRDGTVVDLGCGSGILARRVSDAGFDVLGVDLSEDMLALAARNAPTARFLHASLADVDLPPAVAVTAIGEALNYATDPRAGLATLEQVAERVATALVPGGLFLFDVATPGRHGARVDERFHDHGEWALHRRAEERADGSALERMIVIFRRDGELYRRTDEHHVLRLYEPDAVEAALRRAGFARVDTRAAYGTCRSSSTPAAGWRVFAATTPTV